MRARHAPRGRIAWPPSFAVHFPPRGRRGSTRGGRLEAAGAGEDGRGQEGVWVERSGVRGVPRGTARRGPPPGAALPAQGTPQHGVVHYSTIQSLYESTIHTRDLTVQCSPVPRWPWNCFLRALSESLSAFCLLELSTSVMGCRDVLLLISLPCLCAFSCFPFFAVPYPVRRPLASPTGHVPCVQVPSAQGWRGGGGGAQRQLLKPP